MSHTIVSDTCEGIGDCTPLCPQVHSLGRRQSECQRHKVCLYRRQQVYQLRCLSFCLPGFRDSSERMGAGLCKSDDV